MPRYRVTVPVEINWRVYKRGDVVTVPDESVVWGVRLPDAPVAEPAPAKPVDTLSELARQQHATDLAQLARIGAPVSSAPPVGIQPRPAPPAPEPVAPELPAPEPAPGPAADLMS